MKETEKLSVAEATKWVTENENLFPNKITETKIQLWLYFQCKRKGSRYSTAGNVQASWRYSRKLSKSVARDLKSSHSKSFMDLTLGGSHTSSESKRTQALGRIKRTSSSKPLTSMMIGGTDDIS